MTEYLIFRAIENDDAQSGYYWECIAKTRANGPEQAVKRYAEDPEHNPRYAASTPGVLYEHWAAVPISNFTWLNASTSMNLELKKLEISPAPNAKQLQLPDDDGPPATKKRAPRRKT